MCMHAVSDYKKQWSEISIGVSWKLPISRRWPFLNSSSLSVGPFLGVSLELVSKELNHLVAILHAYAGVWILLSKKKY